MKNKGLFSTLFIEEIREEVELDDNGQGRMATLAQKWQTRDDSNSEMLWDSFLKQAISYLQFVPPQKSTAPNVYCLFEDYSFTSPVTVLYFVSPKVDIDDVSVGRIWPGKLVAELKKRNLNWGILTNAAKWRLYSLKTSKPYEDFVELDLVSAISGSDEKEYALFERFFHRDSFVMEEEVSEKYEKSELGETHDNSDNENSNKETNNDAVSLYKCRLDADAKRSEEILEELVKAPFLSQLDEILQYVCNGFIADTERKGEEYTEEERREIFESAVKLLYRALFLFYAEARSLLPSDPEKANEYRKHSIRHLCEESRKFRWNQRNDSDGYDLWKHLKGLVNAVNDGDPEYGIMGYNGGLFNDQQEKFLGKHKLRNDFLARALYLLAYVEPWDNDPENEYAIPYEDLEVRHLGELYENILEFNVALADADRIRRRTKKGIEVILASEAKYQPGDTRIKKGDIFFGETALERKQTGSYYTPEVLVQFLNQKAIINPLHERFDKEYRKRFDEFCRDMQGGRDTSTRRGAAQSAIALIERFVQEVVLRFKTCDPGMGSGHFLVNAANQISNLIVELLSEISHIEGLKSKTTCAPNHWRRLVTRHCVYGVDLNPLAVYLAKLSLWLNCFAQDHRLAFLDHHLKCGNSLIGIRSLGQLEKLPERAKEKKRKNVQELLFPIDLKKACRRALDEIDKIERLDEDSTDKMKELLDDSQEENSGVIVLADFYTTYLLDHSIEEENYRELFSDLARGQKPDSLLAKEILQSDKEKKFSQHFFHWAIEFPEIFGNMNPGFSATTGNPPWDILKPNSQEFFSIYDPDFRCYEKLKANKVIERLTDKYETIRVKWETYCKGFEEQSLYVRQPSAFRAVGNGDINTYKLFLEQFFALLRTDGIMGIVTPSGLYTDQGCLLLRKLFFDESQIELLYCFENRWPTVFNAVDGRFKFVLFCATKGSKTKSFKCAFMEHDPERLHLIESAAVDMKIDHIRKFSPESLSVMEFKNQKELDITTTIYAQHPLICNGWGMTVAREVDLTGHGHMLTGADGDGPALYEGKMIWAYDCDFGEASFTFIPHSYNDFYRKDTINRLVQMTDMKKEAVLRRIANGKVELAPERYRLAFREVSAPTNERTFVGTVLPIPNPHCYTIRTFEHYTPRLDGPSIAFVNRLSVRTICLWCGIINSLVFDFTARVKGGGHLSTTYMDLPIPSVNKRFIEHIIVRTLRLLSVDKRFAPLWSSVFSPEWLNSDFWFYEKPYGPAEEQQIRRKLAKQAKSLTPKWRPECGVHDRLPDRRDTGDRAQLRAEIDAYVALLYGLKRSDFVYILNTFPVLKKKELQAFGEFRSQRKCLEEYDRLEKYDRAGEMEKTNRTMISR